MLWLIAITFSADFHTSEPDLTAMLAESESASADWGRGASGALRGPGLGLRVTDLGAAWRDWNGLCPWSSRCGRRVASSRKNHPGQVKDVYESFLRSKDLSLAEWTFVAEAAARWEPFPQRPLAGYFRALGLFAGPRQLAESGVRATGHGARAVAPFAPRRTESRLRDVRPNQRAGSSGRDSASRSGIRAASTLGGVAATKNPSSQVIDEILQRGASGGTDHSGRGSPAVYGGPFHPLGEAADTVRRRRYPGRVATYLIDSQYQLYESLCDGLPFFVRSIELQASRGLVAFDPRDPAALRRGCRSWGYSGDAAR